MSHFIYEQLHGKSADFNNFDMQHPEVIKFAQLTLNCCHTTLGSAYKF